MPNSLQRVAAGIKIPGNKNLFVQLDDEDDEDDEDEDDCLLDDDDKF